MLVLDSDDGEWRISLQRVDLVNYQLPGRVHKEVERAKSNYIDCCIFWIPLAGQAWLRAKPPNL